MFSKTCKNNYFILEVYNGGNDTTEEPLTILLVHQTEIFEFQAAAPTKTSISFEYLSIGGRYQLNNTRVFSRANSFEGSLHYSNTDHRKNIASISSLESYGGDIIIRNPELRGHHIATYFIDKIINWLKTQAGETAFQMKELKLISADYVEEDSENGRRRNQLYLNFGYELDLREDGSGNSQSIQLTELRNRDTWKSNILEVELQEYVKGIYLQNKALTMELAIYQDSPRIRQYYLKTSSIIIFVSMLVVIVIYGLANY